MEEVKVLPSDKPRRWRRRHHGGGESEARQP